MPVEEEAAHPGGECRGDRGQHERGAEDDLDGHSGLQRRVQPADQVDEREGETEREVHPHGDGAAVALRRLLVIRIPGAAGGADGEREQQPG